MLSSLELAKKKLELSKVRCGREEMEYRVLERMADIERLEENIKLQKAKEEEIEAEISREG